MDDEERERSLKHMNWLCPPINFSVFPDLSISFDDDIFDSSSDFHNNNDSATQHIINFTQSVIDSNVVREIDLMYFFSCLLSDDAYDWFQEDVPINSISSLAELLKIFLIKWHHKDIHYVDFLVEQFLVHLPKENHIETPQDSSLDCDEPILEDPIEISHIDEILEEGDESLIPYIYDETFEEPSRENPIEPCPEIIEHLENLVFSISDDEISENLETFEGEPIYDSFSDECSIPENDEINVEDSWEPIFYDSLHIFDQPCTSIDNTDFEPPSWDDGQSCPTSPMVDDLDCFNLPCTSYHVETFQPSNPPIFDNYPCEDSASLCTFEDEICTGDPHHFQSHTHPFLSPSSSDSMHEFEKPSPSFSSPPSDHHDIISSLDLICDDDPYVSPVHLWIVACCENDLHYLKNMNKCLYTNNLMSLPKYRLIMVYKLFQNKGSLLWMVTKDKGQKHDVDQMLDWLHWLFHYT